MKNPTSCTHRIGEAARRFRAPLIALTAAGSLALTGCAADKSDADYQKIADQSVSSLGTIMRDKGYDVLDVRPSYDRYISLATAEAAVGTKCIVAVDTPLYQPNDSIIVSVATNPDLGDKPVDSIEPFLSSRNDIPTLQQLMARPLVARSCE